jgi:hypothetical protein
MAQRRRRVAIRTGDLLVLNGFEIDAAILSDIVNPDKRLLWAFVRGGDDTIRPVAYTEDRVIWLAEEDLVRNES